MITPILRLPVLGACLLLTLPAPAADPLPEGAKVRLGTTLLRNPAAWTGAALTPDGKYLVTQTPNGLTKYDVATGEPAGAVGPKGGGGGGGYGGQTEISGDGKRGLTLAFSSARVWDVQSGKPLAEVKRPLPVNETGAALSADGKLLAVGGGKDFTAKDKPITAVVWDVEKNEKRAEVTVLQNQSANVALSPDGTVLATWGSHYEPAPPKDGPTPATDPNRVIQFWDVAAAKELAKVHSPGYGLARVAFTPDGRTAAVAHGTGLIRMIDPKTGTETRRLFGRSDQGLQLAVSPDGKVLASAGADGVVQLWGVADGARLGVVESPIGPLPAGVRGVRFTAPDRAVVWVAVGSTAVVWEVPSGKLLSPVSGHLAAIRSVVFAADGKEVVTGGEDGQVLRWDAATGKQTGEVVLRRAGGFNFSGRYALGSVQLNADGKSAVLDQVGVFDLATGRQVSAPLADQSFRTRPYLCGDGRTLLLGPPFDPAAKEQPAAIRITAWDVGVGTKLTEIESPFGDLTAAAVTPDRSKLVTVVTTRPPNNGKSELLVTSWELATGKKLGTLTQPATFGSAYMALAPDNTNALLVTTDGKLNVVDVVVGKVTKDIDAGGRVSLAPVFGPGGKFATVSATGYGPTASATVRVYDWTSGKPTATIRAPHAATCLAFSPDGKTLATGGTDTTVLLWDAAAGKE